MSDTLPVPADVRLMNFAATALFCAGAALVLAAVFWWALRHPVFAIGGMTVLGDVTHNNAVTLRANVAPRLTGNFFTVNLPETRAVFESVPWVRQAVVRREFPNRLQVTLQEHQAQAYWGAEGESRLVNRLGEVFEANVADVEQEDLPRLSGPEGQSAQVLEMYRAVKPLFDALELTVEQLALSSRGGWSVSLDNGASVELGRGTTQEVAARTQRFVQTVTQMAARQGRRPEALLSADLRHSDGYALRLRGVTTGAEPAKK